MTKLIVFLMLIITLFSLTGCASGNVSNVEITPANLKDVTNLAVLAEFNQAGNIIIKKSDITTDVMYISYEYEGVTIGLIAVKDASGKIHVVVNTCQSCGGSPYAYFLQNGEYLQCQNCGSLFKISELDNLVTDGCNPISIKDLSEEDDYIIVGVQELKELKDKFVDWKGPKV